MKYDITDFGARRGEDAPQTGAIQAAIDACFLAGGGEVVVPEGTAVGLLPPPARKTTGTPGLSPYAAAHGTTR